MITCQLSCSASTHVVSHCWCPRLVLWRSYGVR